MEKYFAILGCQARDRVSGFSGVVESISFDLYGCVIAVVRPPHTMDKDKVDEGRWFDVKRLEILDPNPVMAVPDFLNMSKGQEAGAASKPPNRRG